MKKKGILLLYALGFLFVISLLGFFILSYQNKTNNEIVYNVESSKNKLIGRSATEYAIMALQAHDFENKGCVNTITYKKNEITVTITPTYFMKDCSVCNNLPSNRCINVSTKEEIGNVLFYTVINNDITNQRLVEITYQKL